MSPSLLAKRSVQMSPDGFEDSGATTTFHLELVDATDRSQEPTRTLVGAAQWHSDETSEPWKAQLEAEFAPPDGADLSADTRDNLYSAIRLELRPILHGQDLPARARPDALAGRGAGAASDVPLPDQAGPQAPAPAQVIAPSVEEPGIAR